ncbi:hypothetical protein ACQP2X_34945 [Actinoplanes sp. CA-131856]
MTSETTSRTSNAVAGGRPVIGRASACLVVEVELAGDPPWHPGPLPVRSAGGTGRDLVAPAPADQVRRLTYFESRVSESLYGARWWQDSADDAVAGVEIVRLPYADDSRAALMVVHVHLDPADPVAALGALVAAGPAAGLLPPGAVVRPGRVQTVAHVTFVGDPPVPSAAYDWPAHRQWAWLLASATPFDRVPPDPEDTALFDGEVRLSRDWTALVLRDGAAFVGRTPDGGTQSFHHAAEVYVHSLYLDVFLLGRMQWRALNDFANRVATARSERLDPSALSDLEHRLVEIRRNLWIQQATSRGIGNELLARHQAQHRLTELMAHVETDMGAAVRFLEAVTGRSVNAALGLLTVVGLPFGLAYAGGAIWADPSPRLFWTCTLLAAVAAVLLAVLLPPIRPMIRSLRRRGPN